MKKRGAGTEAYIAILEKEESSLFSVFFPDLAGCVTAAASADDAVSRAAEALRLYAENMIDDGETPPEPRGIEAISRDPEIRALLAAGAVAFRVPLLIREQRPIRLNVSLDARTVAQIDDAARKHGITRSGFIALAAEEKIGRSL
jgi:predicted RNase H-like HicB family nuclease